MNCHTIRAQFSPLADDALDAKSAAAVRSHLEACDACRGDFVTFVAALEALRDHALAPVSAAHTASVMAAVDAAAREQGAERRRAAGGWWRSGVARHAATALVSAAAAIALWTFAGFGPRPAGPGPRDGVAIRVVPAAPLVRLDPGWADGILDRLDGSIGRVESALATLRRPAADAPAPRDALPLAEADAAFPALEVDLGALARSPAVARAAAVLGAGAGEFRDEVRSTVARAFVVALVGAREVLVRAAAEEHAAEEHAEPDSRRGVADASPRGPWRRPQTLVIRSEAGHVTLETNGQYAEIIPALISRLRDDDGAVRSAVARRLEEIRQELERNPEFRRAAATREEKSIVGGALSVANRIATARVGDLFARRADESGIAASRAGDAPGNDLARWEAWWTRHSLAVLESETIGTW